MRGEIWTVAAAGYASKPRPAVVVQADEYEELESITVCLMTSDPERAEDLLRIQVPSSEANGLRRDSRIMIDKVVTVPRSKLGERLGILEPIILAELESSLLAFLGLTRSGV